jgi:hypothetical protein
MKKLMVVLFAALLLVAFSAPAMAQLSGSSTQWGFYGSARMFTAYVSKDANTPTGLFGAPGNARAVGGAPTYDDEDIAWQLQDNSRFGVNVAAGNITGQVEMGNDPSGDNFEAIRLRIIKGTWNFGPGSLKVGQDYTPLFFPISDQCGVIGGDCGLIFWGTLYVGRVPQLTLTMGGFQFSLMSPARAANGGIPAHNYTANTGFTAVEYDTNLPKIEASYTFNLGPVALFLGGGYKTHDMVGATDNEESVDSFILTAAVKAAFGPFYINGQIYYAENPGDYGATQDNLFTRAVYWGADLHDVESWAGAIVAGFKITDAMKLEAGIGAISNSLDTAAGVESEQMTVAYYIQFMWSPVKNVFIVPEFGLVDYNDLERTGTADEDLGAGWYLGIKWQINF